MINYTCSIKTIRAINIQIRQHSIHWICAGDSWMNYRLIKIILSHWWWVRTKGDFLLIWGLD